MEYAVDVGGTKIAYALVHKGQVIEDGEVKTQRAGPERQLAEIGGRLHALAEKHGASPNVAGLSLPGPIADGKLRRAPNLDPGWVGRSMEDFARMLGLDVPLFGQRDALLGGVGEAGHGAGRGLGSFAYLTLGTGVGGALIVDGEPLTGAKGAAGEIGHLMAERRGPKCGCGRRGCVEAIASGTAIGRLYAVETGREIGGREIADRARAGDAVALTLYRRAGRALAVACAAWAQVANPEAVIVGGSLSNALDLMQASLQRELALRAWDANLPLPIRVAELGGPAPLVGAAEFARRRG